MKAFSDAEVMVAKYPVKPYKVRAEAAVLAASQAIAFAATNS